MEFFFTPEVIVMSFIRKPLGYKERDLKCSFILLVTHVTGHLGPQAEMIISLKCLTT